MFLVRWPHSSKRHGLDSSTGQPVSCFGTAKDPGLWPGRGLRGGGLVVAAVVVFHASRVGVRLGL